MERHCTFSSLAIVILLTLLPGAVTSVYGYPFDILDPMPADDGSPIVGAPVRSSSGAKAMFVWVVFPGEEPTGVYPEPAMRDSVSIGLTQYLWNQSRNFVDVTPFTALNPSHQDGWWVADHSAETYNNYGSVAAVAQYMDHWLSEPLVQDGYLGELPSEIIYKIYDAYIAAGQGNPFADVAMITFLYDGNAITYGGANTGGYGRICADRSAFSRSGVSFLGVMSDDLADPFGWVPGATIEDDGTSYDFRWKIAHETVHFLGYGQHLSAGGCPCDPYGLSLEGCHYGPYALMRQTVISGKGPTPIHMSVLELFEWVFPTIITQNTLNYELEDFGFLKRVLKIPLPPLPPEWDCYGNILPQYFYLTYHGGHGIDVSLDEDGETLFPSRGLAVQHNSWGGTWDFESAWGRYDNPDTVSADPSAWTIENAAQGYDNHDVWVEYCDGTYPDCNDPVSAPSGYYQYYDNYGGSERDFFGAMSGKDEFSFRSNPTTYAQGQCLTRRGAQNVPNTICIRIVEERGTSVVLDIYLNYEVDLATPLAGDSYVVDEPITIQWATDDVEGLSATCMVTFRPDEAAPWETVVTGVSTMGGQCTWTPDVSHISPDGELQVLFTTVDGLDVPGNVDGTIQIVDPPVFVDRTLNDDDEEQISYQKLPYSSISIDYDDTGPRDLVISFLNDPADIHASTELIYNDGIPKFEVRPLAFSGGVSPEDLLGLSVADVDNDGDEDFFAASQSAPRLYRLESDGQYHDMSSTWGVSQQMLLSATGAWADYDRDGDVDLLIGTANCGDTEPGNGSLYGSVTDVLLRNDLTTGGGFTDVSASAGLMTSNSSSVSWTDINNDGYPDAFVGEILEPVSGPGGVDSHLYVNQGDGSFVDEMDTRIGTLAACRGAIWRDMDSDGDIDLEVATGWNRMTGTNSGAGVLSVVTSEITGHLKPYSGLRLFDHDLDGYEDILLLPSAEDDTPRLLLQVREAGVSTFQNITTLAGIDMVGKIGGAVTADLNGDGDTDLFLGRDAPRDANGVPTGNATSYLFQSASNAGTVDDPANHWLGVRLASPSGLNNKLAIGAKATLTVDGQPRVRYVDGGSGRGGQDDLTLIFGLGNASVVGNLVIDWPNDHQQTVLAAQLTLDAVNAINDDSALGVVIGSLTFDVEVVPGTLDVDWIFTWETSVWTNPTLDRVTFDTGSMSPACAAGVVDIQAGMYGVEHSVTPLTGSRQRHQMIWRDRTCVPKCTIYYQGHSQVNDVTTSSSPKSKQIRFCLM